MGAFFRGHSVQYMQLYCMYSYLSTVICNEEDAGGRSCRKRMRVQNIDEDSGVGGLSYVLVRTLSTGH